uniref:Adenylate cyclase type 9 n=1 Tax=Trichuris muris TaxID=70415 RepID=A0A5S6QJB0_TRIMR
MKSNNLARPLGKESVYDASSIPMISGHLAFPYESQDSISRDYLGKKHRQKSWTLFSWSLSRCWSPEFTSRVLESQYWQCAFPQIRLRFRAGLAYTIIYTIVWMTYFTSLYSLSEITSYVIFSTLVLVIFISVFAFTFTNTLYCRLYVPTSVFCICLVAVSSVFVFMIEKPALTPLARFALSVEVILLIYTVIPLPMYLCVVLALAFSILFEELRFSPTSIYRPRGVMFSFYTLAHILGVHIFVLMQVRDRKTFIKVGQSLLARKDLEIEKEFKDRMIESVMPRMVAEELMKESNELKRPSNTPSDRGSNLFRPFTMNLMHNVSILFADIVGFTKMSSNKSADELVNMLNDLFGRFDALCGKCGCEKISTLGDCYYCVSGCPEPRADHAICCVEMGLSMIEAIHQFDVDREQEVNMRVGIHTGTVLCGIVGRRRFKFDVFSNDVDLANMMESTGQSGRVHISESTAKFLGNEYTLEDGPVYKNKLRTYFIVDRISRTKGDVARSPPVFGLMPNVHRLTDLRHIDSSDITITAKDVSKKASSIAQHLNKTQSVHNLFAQSDPSKAAVSFEHSLPCFKDNKSASTTMIDPNAIKGSPKPALSTNRLGSRNSRNVTFKASLSEYDALTDKEKMQSQHSSAREQSAERNGVESSIDHVLSTHTASISRFEASHEDFDLRLAEAIRGSSLTDGDYLIRRKALNPLTLKFIDPVVETKYRKHFCAESHDVLKRKGFLSTLTGITRHQERSRDQWQVDAPKLSVLFDVLISILMFVVLNSLAFFGFGVSNIAFIVYVLVCLLFTVAFLCLTAFYLIRHGVLPPVLVKWWPKHVFSLFLINLPLGIMLTNLHCPAEQFSFIQTVNMGENYLLFICLMIMMVMFGHVNFSQIRSWPKSVSCFLLGLCLIGLVQFCLHSCDGQTLILVDMALANLSSPYAFLGDNTTARMSLVYNISSQISGAYGDSKACFQTEIYIVIFLSFLLIVFVNYQFEATFRMSFYGDMQACETIRKMKEMKDQADWLLSNIIPHHVVEQLARTSKYSENHEMIAVLFASIVNWNEMYEETYEGGREFLRVLNELISDFDELLDRPEFTQVEKIKTIGPTYMAAAGLNPERRRLSMHPYSHLYALMEFALALQETLDNFNKDLLSFEFIMKIGYNIGPVTAGVIGTTKLYYDIWGDTVNISSRMYSTGVKGRIQVSRQAKDRLESVYDFEFRDHIDVKGVDGGMDVFLLKQRKQNMTPRSQKPLTLDGP